MPGGHRIGLAGEVVVDETGRIITIKYVTFMNIRISHQILGVADSVIGFLCKENKVKNSLIVSPPGCGKTTMLRDIVRQLSRGNYKRKAFKVGVVDERNEINPVQTDTTDSNYVFDNEDAIVVNLKNKKNK